MDNWKTVCLEKMEAADMILVGIGEEMSADIRKITEIPEYASFLMELDEKEQWMRPWLEQIYLHDYADIRIQKAYSELEKILRDKNYFIISVCSDDYIYDTELLTDRIVTPCGGYRYMQCSAGCRKNLTEADCSMSDALRDCVYGDKGKENLVKPVCASCGADLVFNKIGLENYLEEGYMEQWGRYRKWLQGTVNRELCILELGVGMHFPTVIRWPFEKVAFFNQKASFFRIHSKLYQLTEEIKDRGVSGKENPIDFLINGFV